MLKTEGRQDESIDAYRRSIALDPAFGDAYWSLANLKTFRFTPGGPRGDAPRSPTRSSTTRIACTFILRWARPARTRANMRRPSSTMQWAIRYIARAINTTRTRTPRGCGGSNPFSRASSSPSARDGLPAPDPIFIVGMPRSGSTLLEQILSSHSAIEGTQELPELITMARELRDQSEAEDIGVLRRRSCAACHRRRCGISESATSSGPVPPQDRTGRSSSTRCRTTSCTWR